MDSLSGAKWIGLPAERIIPNSFLLYKKAFALSDSCNNASLSIFADSRYVLYINGVRVGFGPAPCDPRHQEWDSYDVAGLLRVGENVIAVHTLFYGFGEGTWVTGKSGLICKLVSGEKAVVSDESWYVKVDRSHKNGNYKRWYLRSLQEICDLRLWDETWLGTPDVSGCVHAAVLGEDHTVPSVALPVGEYMSDSSAADPGSLSFTERTIPLLREHIVATERKLPDARIVWKRDPEDWFDFRLADSFTVEGECEYDPSKPLPDGDGALLTYVFREEIVGFPIVELEADDGCVIELITQESHDESVPQLLDTGFYAWSRWICKKGYNRIEAFDYESVKYLQLHVRCGRAKALSVSVRRRVFDWANPASFSTGDPALGRLLDACLNTVCNDSLETAMDGVARERQQYMGDLGHLLNAHRWVFGESRLPQRVLTSFSYGQTPDGYYLDCWPAFDRCNRIYQRMLGLTPWGPIIDHGVQFVIECWDQYLYDGDFGKLSERADGIMRFCHYLDGLRRGGDTLPVEGFGVEYVWLDHYAYRAQKHKECAFNLYVIAMLKSAVTPILSALGMEDPAIERLLLKLNEGVTRKFFDGETFVANLPWAEEEGGKVYDDRSLATSVLYDIVPESRAASVKILAERPANLGISYPANAYWRLKALLRNGRADVFFGELSSIWANMTSVVENNTVQEVWESIKDSTYEFSHAAVCPLHLLYTDVLGIKVLEPGCKAFSINPISDFDCDLSFRARLPEGYVDYEKRGDRVTVSASDNYRECPDGVFTLK